MQLYGGCTKDYFEESAGFFFLAAARSVLLTRPAHLAFGKNEIIFQLFSLKYFKI